MTARVHVIAGRCRTEFDNDAETTVSRGHVVAICKPDNTLLVHDADGYQPVAWLTRPASLVVDGNRVEAVDGNQRLRLEVLDAAGRETYPVDEAGTPVAPCPECGEMLVRSKSRVRCENCDLSHGLPADAVVTDEVCEDCGLALVTVERGEAITACLDPACESIHERVREAFDRVWDCPDCGADLRVLQRGGLRLGCDAYPDCETSYSFPAGTVADTCGCGLPVFEMASGDRCLDETCSRA